MRARILKNNQTLDGIYPARLITAIPRTILRMPAVGRRSICLIWRLIPTEG